MTDTPQTTCWTVALTGGIAAGKSAAGRAFAACGIAVHDADVAAREVVMPGTPGLAEIVATFGVGVLDAAGQLDRRALRERVFADIGARRRLEAIVHPRVNAWLRERVQADTGPYGVLAIPLLVETWPQYAWVDRVAVVEAPVATRIARLMQRDGIDAAAAQRMLDAQASDAARRAIADDIIDNHGDLAALDATVGRLHRRYLKLAATAR
ncbi:MAG TPA: dephospho-CoA kinase [Rhodanobacteraceae bacterium]